jgi:long-chain acyl-CoA synthetase
VTLEASPAPPVSRPAAWTAGRTAAWLARQVEVGLADVDLSVPQYRVLGVLAQGSAVSSVLAERLAVRPPSVTSVVDGLVSRGLVRRQPREDDRRCVALALTGEGEATLDAADRAVGSRFDLLLEALADRGRASVALDGLEAWREAMTVRALAAGRR